MERQRVIKRIRSLRNLEGVNIFLMPIVLYWIVAGFQPSNWLPYAVCIFAVSLILAEGTLYWYLKLQSVLTHSGFPPYFAALFRWFQRINLVLFATCLGVLCITAFSGRAWLGATPILIFAILEHINYFHYQLMHDNHRDLAYLSKHRRLRRSPLSDDLARQRVKS